MRSITPYKNASSGLFSCCDDRLDAASGGPPPSYLGFALEKRPLAFSAPPVSRQVAIAAHSSVTRNCDRQGVCRTCLRYRPDRARCADSFGQKRVAHRGASWHFLQSIPYTHLEIRAANIEG